MSSTPLLRLLYLPVRARAENLRMMLYYKKFPFEDKILTFPEFFALQKSLPFDQLPVLEVEQHGKKVLDLGAIFKFNSRQCWRNLALSRATSQIYLSCDQSLLLRRVFKMLSLRQLKK
jgi:hypothetical protein